MGLKLYKKLFLYNYRAFFRAIIIHFSFCFRVLNSTVSEPAKNTTFQIHSPATKRAAPIRHRPENLSFKNSYIPLAPPETVSAPTFPEVPDWSVSV